MKKKTIQIGDTLVEIPDFLLGDKNKYLWLLIVFWALSGIYIVGPDENGVVRRFGEKVQPGGG